MWLPLSIFEVGLIVISLLMFFKVKDFHSSQFLWRPDDCNIGTFLMYPISNPITSLSPPALPFLVNKTMTYFRHPFLGVVSPGRDEDHRRQ